MTYSKRLKTGIGAVRTSLRSLGIDVQDTRFTKHGEHTPDTDAPLILVACSGGRDSIALAALATRVCAMIGARCGAVIIDHNMQAGSGDVAQQAAAQCQQLGLNPVRVQRVQVVQSSDIGAEAAARDARYAAICDIARTTNAAAVLLAHTKNDQAETVLIGLLRSGGVDALAGMPETFTRDGVVFARPLLDLTRGDTTGICEDLGLDWWDDPTNGDVLTNANSNPTNGDALTSVDPPALSVTERNLPLRSRIRHKLIPFMAEFTGSDIVAHLAAGARATRRDKDYLDTQADRALAAAILDPADDILRLSAQVLAREHPAIRVRVIAHALAAANVSVTSAQLESIDRLIADWHGQSAVQLPRGYSAFRQKHVIRVCQYGGHANRRRPR